MARTHAPERARQSLALRHALASWNFAAASALADSLAPAALTYDAWMSADEIREGGTIAKLKLGDPLAARKFWVSLSPVATRPADSIRSLLLDSYLIDAYNKAARH
jgi:hypothetical protein